MKAHVCLALVVFTIGCAATTQLKVRVHLLKSSLSELDSTLNGKTADVYALFDEANTLWAQAGIDWNVTEVLENVPARRTDVFEKQVLLSQENPAVLLGRANETVYPTDATFAAGGNGTGVFNVVFVRSLGRLGSYVYNHRAFSLMVADSPAGDDKQWSGGVRLAQGLGQMLGLSRASCLSTPTNLLITACGLRDGTPKDLDACQQRAALAQAAIGGPWARTRDDGTGACPCDGCGTNFDVSLALGIGSVVAVVAVTVVVVSYWCHLRRRRARLDELEREEDEAEDEVGYGGSAARFRSNARFDSDARFTSTARFDSVKEKKKTK